MRAVDCPFRAADRVLAALASQTRCIVVDVHAEATADKYLVGHFLKGRVSAVLGTHTHVPTADEQIFPGGTAFISDVGMTGPYDSILGRRIDRVLPTTLTFVPSSFEVASDDLRLAGALVDFLSQTEEVQLNDAARLAWDCFENHGCILQGALEISRGGAILRRLGYDEDIRAACQVDRFHLVPELRREPLRVEVGAVGIVQNHWQREQR